MSTITIYKLLSYEDTMTLIRNACVGLDITLTEHDIETIERGVDYFFSLIKKYAELRKLRRIHYKRRMLLKNTPFLSPKHLLWSLVPPSLYKCVRTAEKWQRINFYEVQRIVTLANGVFSHRFEPCHRLSSFSSYEGLRIYRRLYRVILFSESN